MEVLFDCWLLLSIQLVRAFVLTMHTLTLFLNSALVETLHDEVLCILEVYNANEEATERIQ